MTFNLNKISGKIAAWVAVLAIVLPMNLSAASVLAAGPSTPAPSNPSGNQDPFYTNTGFTQTWSSVLGAVTYNYESCYQDIAPAAGVTTCDPSNIKDYTATYTTTSKSVPANQAESHFFWHVQSEDDVSHATSAWSPWLEITIDKTLPQVGLTAPASVTNSNTVNVLGYVTDTNMSYYACYITTNQNITAFNKTWSVGEEPKSGINNDQSLADANCLTKWTSTNTGSPTNPALLGSFDATGLPDGSYTIHVTGHDLAGNVSGATTPFTIDRAIPATPTNFVATAGNGQVNLTWDTVPTADHYRVTYNDKTVNPITPVYSAVNTVPGNPTSLKIDSLINGHIYDFNIQAVDALGKTSLWRGASATPDLPLAPANFVATPGNGQVRLNWDTFAGVDHYKVCNVTTGLCYNTQTFHSQQFTFINLNNGQAYDFNIQAMNANNEPISAIATASGTPTAPVVTVASARLGTSKSSYTFRDSSSTGKADKNDSKDKKDDKDNKASDKNGKIKGEETKNDTASDKAVLTFVILLLALAAGIGGYYAYEWWLTKQDEKPVAPIEDKKENIEPKPNNNKPKSNSKKRKNGRW